MWLPTMQAIELAVKLLSYADRRLNGGVLRSLGLGLFIGMAVFSTAAGEVTSELPDFRAQAITPNGLQPMGKTELLGHVWVADFIFTTCSDICPRMSRQMRRLQNRLPAEVRLVSFTIDPERDTPDTLRDYAHEMEADPDRWFFLRMK